MTDAARWLEIEQHALAAWPAREVEAFAGWQLRAMSGVSQRANSAWTVQATGTMGLAQRIAHVESFYRARGLTPSFQLGAQSVPAGLDRALAERGYAIASPVSVQIAHSREVSSSPSPRGVRAEVEAELSDAWFELSGRRGRFADVQDVYRGLLTRLGARARFAIAYVDERPAAVGLGVRDGRWLGVSSMFTLPGERGRGAARAVLAALAAHAPEAATPDAPNVYLQVERENLAALALYARVGFVHHHAYHYRRALSG